MREKELKVLIFKLNGEYYATDIMEVERILGYEQPTKIPDSPAYFEGVINYQGTILPVLNLAKKFNLDYKGVCDETKIIVAKQDETRIGVIVDVVSEVRDVNEESMEEPTDVVFGISKRYMKGLIKLNEKIIMFLNLSRVLSEDEKNLII